MLGEPYYIAMRRLNLGIVRSDGNAMWSLAPHDVSILCAWLEREPISVNASGVAHLQPGVEDVVFLTIQFDGGVLGHVQSSWLDPNKVREATVVGSEKVKAFIPHPLPPANPPLLIEGELASSERRREPVGARSGLRWTGPTTLPAFR